MTQAAIVRHCGRSLRSTSSRRRCLASPSTGAAPVDEVVGRLERLRGGLGSPSGLPLLTDADLIADDVVYDGPLASARGRDAYRVLNRAWAEDLPKRLAGFEVAQPALFAGLDGTRRLTLRWRARFGAPLPPRAASRLAALGQPPPRLTPAGLLAASLSVRSDLEMDAAGRVVRHTEALTDDFDVASTVARFEFLLARRRGELLPLAYARVLRHTSLAEAKEAAGGELDAATLDAGFARMVAANFATGLALGCAVYVAVKAARAWLAIAADAPPLL